MDAKGNIEAWLQRLVDGMQATIKTGIKRAVHEVYVSGVLWLGWGEAGSLQFTGVMLGV